MVDGFVDVVWLFVNQAGMVQSNWNVYALGQDFSICGGSLTKYKCCITLRPDIAHFKHQALL